LYYYYMDNGRIIEFLFSKRAQCLVTTSYVIYGIGNLPEKFREIHHSRSSITKLYDRVLPKAQAVQNFLAITIL